MRISARAFFPSLSHLHPLVEDVQDFRSQLRNLAVPFGVLHKAGNVGTGILKPQFILTGEVGNTANVVQQDAAQFLFRNDMFLDLPGLSNIRSVGGRQFWHLFQL